MRHRCEGCGSEFVVDGESPAQVVCLDCDRVAPPWGDGGAAIAYRVGYAKYSEGRRQLSSGLAQLETGNWVDARALFEGGAGEFEAAVEKFTQAVRRSEGAFVSQQTETAREKATCLWQAADWLGGTAYAREQQAPERTETFQTEATTQLQAAKAYGEIPSPDALAAEVGDEGL